MKLELKKLWSTKILLIVPLLILVITILVFVSSYLQEYNKKISNWNFYINNVDTWFSFCSLVVSPCAVYYFTHEQEQGTENWFIEVGYSYLKKQYISYFVMLILIFICSCFCLLASSIVTRNHLTIEFFGKVFLGVNLFTLIALVISNINLKLINKLLVSFIFNIIIVKMFSIYLPAFFVPFYEYSKSGINMFMSTSFVEIILQCFVIFLIGLILIKIKKVIL